MAGVAAGLERTERPVPRRDERHEALGVLIGRWINEGHTVATADTPEVPILTSDVYEWAPGGLFVAHTAYGRIGEASVGGVEHAEGRPGRRGGVARTGAAGVPRWTSRCASRPEGGAAAARTNDGPTRGGG